MTQFDPKPILEGVESRPCHACGRPRGESHVNRETHPGMLLCAECAGVNTVLKELLQAIRNAIATTESFERRAAVKRVDELLAKIGAKP